MRVSMPNPFTAQRARATSTLVVNSLVALSEQRRSVALVLGTYLLEVFGIAARFIVVSIVALILSAIFWIIGIGLIIFGGGGGIHLKV